MKRVVVIVWFLCGITSLALSQRTSKNNYTGDWEDANSWTGGVAPPGSLTAAHLDLTVNGFITRNGALSVGANTIAEDFIVNDTLVIMGDFTFGINGADLVIGPNAVVIVFGNFTTLNNNQIRNDGIFVVTGNMVFPVGDSDVYDDSGGGELFAGGSVVGNDDASSSNNWGQLETLYPVIYEFVQCGGGAGCVLPVKLSYFQAELASDKRKVELKWATIMEENFQKFIVQRSSDGLHFENIGELAGKGFDIYDIESRYSFTDEYPLIGFNYYRLKAVDLDDSYEYFGVKAVKVSAPKSLAVYPNPSAGEFISFNTNFNAEESDRIVLIDQMGIEIFNLPAAESRNNITVPVKLKPGMYFLRYVSSEFEQTTRVLVKN